MLPERISNQKLTEASLCRTFGTALRLNDFLRDAEDSSLDLSVIGNRPDLVRLRQFCSQIVQYRVNLTAAIPVQLRQVTSWNLNSLQAPCRFKGTNVQSCLVFQSEVRSAFKKTKWSDSDIIYFSTRWLGVIVVATPAAGLRNHAKGGTAILLPRLCLD